MGNQTKERDFIHVQQAATLTRRQAEAVAVVQA